MRRRRHLLLVYLRVVLALFEFVRPAIDVLFCLSLPLYHFTVVRSIGFGSAVTYPHVSFVHTLSYFFTVQHSHHYQMYIVYTIIHLTYSFCLPSRVSGHLPNHMGIIASVCCPRVAIRSRMHPSLRNAIPKRDGAKYVRDHDGSGPAPTTGPDSVRLNNRTTGILQHPISACRTPGHGSLVYHIHMCCQCMRTSRPRNGGAAIVVAEY